MNIGQKKSGNFLLENLNEKLPQVKSNNSKQGQGQLRNVGVSVIKLKIPQYERYSKLSGYNLPGLSRVESLEKDDDEIDISPTFAWSLLFLHIVSTALVPCWLTYDLTKQSHTRNSWRFLILSTLTLPFVAYERRRIADVGGDLFQHINKDLIQQNFIGSINACVQFCFIIEAAKLTSTTHAVTLASLKYYMIALRKISKNQKNHQFVRAGTILVTIAIVCILGDSVIGDHYDEMNIKFSRSKLIRLLGDLLALTGSVISAYFQQKYQIPEEPRFVNLFFKHLFMSFNFICFGYYFGGSELSFNEYYGVFGLVDPSNFVTVFYVGIMLGLNLMVCNIMVRQIYSSFILDTAMAFVPFLSAFLYRLLSLEMVFAYTYLSYGFYLPGILLILIGDNMTKNGEIKINFIVYRPEHVQAAIEEKQAFVELKNWSDLKPRSAKQLQYIKANQEKPHFSNQSA